MAFYSNIWVTSLVVSSFNMHSSVDFLFYCYTLSIYLLLPPLNTHDVIFCGTRDPFLIWVYLYIHTPYCQIVMCCLISIICINDIQNGTSPFIRMYIYKQGRNQCGSGSTGCACLLKWTCLVSACWKLIAKYLNVINLVLTNCIFMVHCIY